MSIKKLFDQSPAKVISSKTVEDLGAEIESDKYTTALLDEKKQFVPFVDFSSPENFAKFGSAAQYYEDTIKRIYQGYPYDGSLYEKTTWQVSSSYLDKYIFEKEYPRTNGYALLSADGWGTSISISGGFGEPTTQEYILIKGGPHVDNVFKLSDERESNLKIDGNVGNTLEFWLKKESFAPSLTEKEVIFDLHLTGTVSTDDNYARLRLELDTNSTPPFVLTYLSGTAGVSNALVGEDLTTATIADDTWHHYALSLATTGSSTEVKLYIDGECNSTSVTGSTVNYVSGAMVASIGSLVSATGSLSVPARGWGKLSGSLDEFRFWKNKRSPKQIGRFWFTQVGGGTNTDKANTELGAYYKFNEGITLTSSTDSIVLDYSGRLSNGAWTGYSSTHRSTGSALVDSSAAPREFKDPIIYSFHPDVKNLLETKEKIGIEYDFKNNASFYASLPAWILDDPEEEGSHTLKKMTQIISSYFDTLHLQIGELTKIQDVEYASGSYKTNPFTNRLLESHGFVAPEIFADAEILAQLTNRTEDGLFEKKLYDVKNRIYQNIYNNLIYLYKSKGTEKAFRNLIHCFGVGDELIKLNLYADQTTFTFEDRYRATSVRKNYINFNDADRHSTTIYQTTSSANPNSVSFITGASDPDIGFTAELEVLFPKKHNVAQTNYSPFSYNSASLFGAHTPVADTNEFTWNTVDGASFQVYAVRPSLKETNLQGSGRTNRDVYFALTSNNGGSIPFLTSSTYANVYDNQKWNIAVKIKPAKHPLVGDISDTPGDYKVEFYGVSTELTTKNNEFYLTGTLSQTEGQAFVTGSKRMYVGAHRENFTGSELQYTDVKAASLKCWTDHIENDAILAHARDIRNFGTTHPYKNAFLFETGSLEIPEMETLALHWDFAQITASGPSSDGNPTTSDATFLVDDVSSGSAELTGRYEWLGNIVKAQHTGRGDFFLPYDKVIDRRHEHSAIQQLPENLYNSDTVNILSRDDESFTREKRPESFFFAIEKSMYQTVSEEILNFFATVVDFNNLIGEPINRYRQEYKHLAKLRQLFFERIQNTPDIEKYTQYYKWIDSSLSQMLQKLVPASARFSDAVRTMIESHILERNKYWTKFPTLEMKHDDPEAGLIGINKHLYNWKYGHAPLSDYENDNCLWWKERSERDKSPLATTDTAVDTDKERVLDITLQVLDRRYTTPYHFAVQESKQFHGGINFSRNKNLDFFEPIARQFNPARHGFQIQKSSLFSASCLDDAVLDDNPKVKFTVIDTEYLTASNYVGENMAPFNIVSSSVKQTDFTGVNLVNVHHDTYGSYKETPIQGPFTEKYVGGKPYRHTWNNFDLDANNVQDRAEGWRLDYNSSRIRRNEPSQVIGIGHDANVPRSVFYRDETAKRPVNIRNIKQTGSSSTIIGNYEQEYQVIQTSGRAINNRFFVDAEGIAKESTESTLISDTTDFTLPRRDLTGSNKWVFAERFSAPGGAEVMSRGFLDVESEEKSVYNAMPFRNLSVRTPLNSLLTEHCGQAGTDSTSGDVSDVLDSDASFHKVNRNPLKRLELDGSEPVVGGTVVTGTVYNNWFVQHSIPRSDLQYSWITASSNFSHVLGHAASHGYASSSLGYVPAIDFISSSIYPSIQFVGHNSSNTISNEFCLQFDSSKYTHLTIDYGTSPTINDDGVMSAWVYRDSATTDTSAKSYIMQAGASGSTAQYWYIDNTNDRMYFQIDPAAAPHTIPGIWESPASLSLSYDKWHHIAVAFNYITSPNVYFSLDGQSGTATETQTMVGAIPSSRRVSGSHYIGAAGDSSSRYLVKDGFSGYIDDVSYWNRRLSSSMLPDMIVSSSCGRIYPSDLRSSDHTDYLIGWWRMTDGGGATLPTLANWSPGHSSSSITAEYNPQGSRMLPPKSHIDIKPSIRYVKGERAIADFVGINRVVNNLVDSSEEQIVGYLDKTNPLDFYSNPVAGDVSCPPDLFNALMLNYNGPYQYPSWKQIRTGEKLLARELRNKNILSHTVEKDIKSKFISSHPITHFSESALVSKFHPLIHSLEVFEKANEATGEVEAFPVWLKHTYANNLSLFSNVQLNNKMGLAPSKGTQIYDDLKKLYIEQQDPWTITTLKEIRYTETIFPREMNMYSTRVRTRRNWTSDFWRDNRGDRAHDSGSNSQGKTISNQSIWPMDARNDFATASPHSGGFDGAGELQNTYVTYHGGSNEIFAGPVYARPLSSSADDIIYGDTKWEAGEQATINPAYDSYDAFSDEIRRPGKDFSILPEFKISDQMDYFINSAGGNFFDKTKSDFLSLTGSDFETSIGNDFYKVYSNTDFLKHFSDISKDHEKHEPVNLALHCDAMLKFIPYEGFFPASRTLQLATLFRESYNNTFNTMSEADRRIISTPFLSPGILYNTIKSGIAVDYPIYTSSFTTSTSPYRLASNFDSRIPFEDLVTPANSIVGKTIYQAESEPHASSSSGLVSDAVETNSTYRLAMHNFLAESINFFLKGSRMTTALSSPENHQDFGKVQPKYTNYQMKIKLSECKADNNISRKAQVDQLMYERSSAFGPAVRGASHLSHDPFLPSYYYDEDYNGYSYITLDFEPDKVDSAGNPITAYNLYDIVQNLTVHSEGRSSAPGSVAEACAMQLTASLNIFAKTKIKTVEYNAITGEALTVKDFSDNISAWAIQPKFETPILNFYNVSKTTPATGDATSKGMWHQYGILEPDENKGLFMGISDVSEPGPTTGSLADLVGFEKEWIKLGTPPQDDERTIREAVVAIPVIKKLNEETKSLETEFIPLKMKVVKDAMTLVEGNKSFENTSVSKAIYDMVKTARNYVLPPKFDFLTKHTSQDVLPLTGGPIAMYFFEFEHSFSRNDITNMWQNIMPESANRFEKKRSSIIHPVGDGGFLSSEQLSDPNLYWIVFKVKQKAEWNYFNKTINTADDDQFKFKFSTIDSFTSKTKTPDYSYNWPYDFCSLIELVKIDAEIAVKIPVKTLTPDPTGPNINEKDDEEAKASTPAGEDGKAGNPALPGGGG